MTRLSHKALDRVLRLLPELYIVCPMPEFLERAVQLMATVVQSDGCGWFVFRMGRSPKLVAFAGAPRLIEPWMLTQFEMSAPPFMDTWEIGRHSLTAPVSATPLDVNSLSFRSYRRTFTDEDRSVVGILQPHLARAFANAQVVTSITQQGERGVTERMSSLTIREAEVAHWMAQGKTNREIGMILGMAARTAEKHAENILRKLQVENRTAAALHLSRTLRQSH